jgi:hypothetical protein
MGHGKNQIKMAKSVLNTSDMGTAYDIRSLNLKKKVDPNRSSSWSN